MKKGATRAVIYAVAAVLSVSVTVGGIALFFNITPDAVGLGDYKLIGGFSLSDLGLSNVKVKDFVHLLWSFRSVDESKIVQNAYDAASESKKAQSALAGAYFGDPQDIFKGKGDYSRIADESLYYPEARTIYLSDKTLAFMLNEALKEEAKSGTAFTDKELSSRIRSSTFSVREVTVSKDGSLRMVLALDTAAVLGDSVPGIVSAVLPDRIYAVSSISLSANKAGVVHAEPESFAINNGGGAAAGTLDAISEGLFGTMENGQRATEYINELMGEYVCSVLNHLGAVGTAESYGDIVLEGSEKYGNSGFSNGGIRLITHTAE